MCLYIHISLSLLVSLRKYLSAFFITLCFFCRYLHRTGSDEKTFAKKLFTLLDLCVSSLRRGHANLLCIVPILTDDPQGNPYVKATYKDAFMILPLTYP